MTAFLIYICLRFDSVTVWPVRAAAIEQLPHWNAFRPRKAPLRALPALQRQRGLTAIPPKCRKIKTQSFVSRNFNIFLATLSLHLVRSCRIMWTIGKPAVFQSSNDKTGGFRVWFNDKTGGFEWCKAAGNHTAKDTYNYI